MQLSNQKGLIYATSKKALALYTGDLGAGQRRRHGSNLITSDRRPLWLGFVLHTASSRGYPPQMGGSRNQEKCICLLWKWQWIETLVNKWQVQLGPLFFSDRPGSQKMPVKRKPELQGSMDFQSKILKVQTQKKKKEKMNRMKRKEDESYSMMF